MRLACRHAVAAALLIAAAAPAARADDVPVFRIEMADGVIKPDRIEVSAGKPFKIEITNSGKTPAEFESVELKREKVLAAGTTSSIVFRRLDPGEYPFFDDFHPGVKALVVAK